MEKSENKGGPAYIAVTQTLSLWIMMNLTEMATETGLQFIYGFDLKTQEIRDKDQYKNDKSGLVIKTIIMYIYIFNHLIITNLNMCSIFSEHSHFYF